MIRPHSLLVMLALVLTACAPPPAAIAPGGQQVYRITAREADQIPFRTLDSVNSLRAASGLSPLELDAALTSAALTHSRDMSSQNRPWHFGSDGSSPLDRIRRAGYFGPLRGENISETYETELETLAAWMEQADTRDVILDAQARKMGIAWHQEDNGKIWWTLVTGA